MEEAKYYVYVYYDPNNKKPFYVGKGTGNRKNKHLYETADTTENIRKYNKIQSIKKGGKEPIIKVVDDNLSEEEAYVLEAQLIKKWGRVWYDANGILTNVCIDKRPPGMKDKQHTSKTKKTLSEKQKEWIKKNGNPMEGRQHSVTSKKLMSEKKKEQGTTVSPAGRLKIGKASSQRNKGKGNPNYGRKRKAMYNPHTLQCKYIDITNGDQKVLELLEKGWVFGLLKHPNAKF